MNFFEQELRKIFEQDKTMSDVRFVGRACYGNLGGDIWAKICFTTLDMNKHYEAMQVSIINRNDGVVDSMLFQYADLFGKKAVSNPNFKDGIVPHIWSYDGKEDWYVYHPTQKDYRTIAANIDQYMQVYQEPEQVQKETQEEEIVLPSNVIQ